MMLALVVAGFGPGESRVGRTEQNLLCVARNTQL